MCLCLPWVGRVVFACMCHVLLVCVSVGLSPAVITGVHGVSTDVHGFITGTNRKNSSVGVRGAPGAGRIRALSEFRGAVRL